MRNPRSACRWKGGFPRRSSALAVPTLLAQLKVSEIILKSCNTKISNKYQFLCCSPRPTETVFTNNCCMSKLSCGLSERLVEKFQLTEKILSHIFFVKWKQKHKFLHYANPR